MDSKDNFLKELGEFIYSIDAEYLVGISNKGITKRADKDLSKVSNIKYEVKNNSIEFKFDDITCSINENIKGYKCSCPSRSICKHVIMCYLYLMKNKEELFDIQGTESKSEEEEKFLELKEISIDTIKKKTGDKNLNDIIKRIEFGVKFEIKEGSIIEVNFTDENTFVKFLGNIENSTCSCKSKELCVHKAEALILYKLKKGYLNLRELKVFAKASEGFDEQKLKEASSKIKFAVEDMLIAGLSRMPVTIMDSLNNLAVICHNYELPNFEKSVRDIREEFSLYFNKNASFVKENLVNKITSLYTRAISLENIKDLDKLSLLVGEFKSSYYEIPPVEFHGFAAEKWKSNSGYEGITYYFLESKNGQIYTYTNALPTYYDDVNYRKSFNEPAPWNLNCSISELSNISLKLIHGKINSQNRISSSSESNGTIIGKSNIFKLNTEKYDYDNWNEILDRIFLDKSEKDQKYNLMFLRVDKFGEVDFNDVTQEFSVPIYDKFNNCSKIIIKFSSDTKYMIRRIERVIKYNRSHYIFGRTYIDGEELVFYPITYYDDTGEVENLTL
ncbi:SWIM zinc finger family protein [Clostridium sp. AWRP]|uniref:SWIM zinc finger family protein n=1 Tax=Clostridium sp. AWRP TaxID=2212991 RepID=UPI000FD74913|nr:SWIM zinc finger family protein [Clostridium sp. AWRP]AZV55654.1 hypothetical protein DMR38_03055 [Clostridium sp. AWRP]